MKKKLLGVLTAALLAASTLFSALAVNAKDVSDYTDVHVTDWYYSYVGDVAAKNLMTGLDEVTFGPGENLSRAQFVTILYRMSGSPAVDYASQFNDVPNGVFFSLPVTWAFGKGIVTGYDNNGLFGSNDGISREQMVTMLYRYAQNTGKDTSASADYSQFPDAGSVSGFASGAMKWAVGSGIIKGNAADKTIAPQGSVSRAVCATVVARFTGFTPPSAPSVPGEVSYQSILDEYSQRLREAAPILVNEYNAESAGIHGDINALAELCNKKIGKLADISVEGIGKMADLMFKNGDSYDTYESWAGKLTDVYTQQAQLITDAYVNSATN